MTAKKNTWSTGHKPGRPRTGELRLVSPNAVKVQEWREKNREKYREYQRQYQAAWAAKNPERTKEIKSGALTRAKNKLAKLALI